MNNTIKIGIYIAIITFFINDLIVDFFSYEFNMHFYLEVIFTILMLYLLSHQIYEVKQTHKQLTSAETKIHNLQGEMIHYINKSFKDWGLTIAENEIAWLIIKGFSFKEIADIRGVSEKTVGQQTSKIYKKSHTNNRHELMSLFLEEFIA
jgi:DNA-binding CsgD family transcriptional regulator